MKTYQAHDEDGALIDCMTYEQALAGMSQEIQEAAPITASTAIGLLTTELISIGTSTGDKLWRIFVATCDMVRDEYNYLPEEARNAIAVEFFAVHVRNQSAHAEAIITYFAENFSRRSFNDEDLRADVKKTCDACTAIIARYQAGIAQ